MRDGRFRLSLPRQRRFFTASRTRRGGASPIHPERTGTGGRQASDRLGTVEWEWWYQADQFFLP